MNINLSKVEELNKGIQHINDMCELCEQFFATTGCGECRVNYVMDKIYQIKDENFHDIDC